MFRSSDIEVAEGATSPTLRALVTELDDARNKRTHGLTIADLLPTPGSPIGDPSDSG